jgi:formate dehydrogenase subunit gamma
VRVFHWVYFASFAILAVTGFILFFPWTPFAVGEAGQAGRLLHRIFAVVLMVAPIVTLLVARRGFWRDTREGFRWGAEDRKSFGVLVRRTYWTGDATGLPPQGKFMIGQKLNIAVQVVMFGVLAVTGLVMWLGKGVLPQGLMLAMILLHALAAIAATCIAIVHIYMVTTLPFTRDAIGTMFTGKMPEDYARSHHAGWRP